ncbi:hypothetical protein TREES_T100001707 [Tupaia chinensis]|uniref:Uncharacterized protein n=1 Tax=Tupaia chinensis TaxID=246437 RepID=L9KIY9_TUPCH|nr:hypothetical protein TREES_T100001707 [Tupaia chinensis]
MRGAGLGAEQPDPAWARTLGVSRYPAPLALPKPQVVFPPTDNPAFSVRRLAPRVLERRAGISENKRRAPAAVSYVTAELQVRKCSESPRLRAPCAPPAAVADGSEAPAQHSGSIDSTLESLSEAVRATAPSVYTAAREGRLGPMRRSHGLTLSATRWLAHVPPAVEDSVPHGGTYSTPADMRIGKAAPPSVTQKESPHRCGPSLPPATVTYPLSAVVAVVGASRQ